MSIRPICFVPRSLAALFFAATVAGLPTLANAGDNACDVGKVRFENQAACAIAQKIRYGEAVPFRPLEIMGVVAEICAAFEGRMDERLKRDQRKALFRTADGFDCYQKGEPIRMPPMRGADFIRQPLIVQQSARRF